MLCLSPSAPIRDALGPEPGVCRGARLGSFVLPDAQRVSSDTASDPDPAARASSDRHPSLPRGWWIIPGIALGLLFWIAAALTAIWIYAAIPVNQAMPEVRNGVLTVGNDYGGRLDTRIAFVEHLRRRGVHVRITGADCASACTLYLGLPRSCVSPHTMFRFHGPSSQIYGVGLGPTAFDRWSRRMAEQYPPQLARWFMAEARNTIVGTVNVRGAELIRLGWARPCRG